VSRTLEGQVAIVTGAGGGIGSAYGERLVERGATVVVADLNLAAAEGAAKTLAGRGLDAWPAEVDISVPESAEGLVRRVLDRNGRLDILVNNAGI
jgi:2-hydroxycyclohexanecarboxyl-CoA dehydrogenase